MFKSAILFRIANLPVFDLEDLDQRARAHAFVECAPTQTESLGWTPPRGEKHGALAELVGGQLLLTLTRERRSVPAAAVKKELDLVLDTIERDTGRRPKGKRVKELKEDVVHSLLPRAFPKRGSATVWVNPAHGLVVVEAASIATADLAATLLVELFGGGISLQLVQTETAPATAMSLWLRDDEARPADFTIDRECELKQPDSEKAVVRYTRHTLDITEVGEHIAQGKLPTKLAMTWNGRVSFVLTDALVLKRVELLDVTLEGSASADSGFDADVAIATGELSRLVPALIDALGGEAAQTFNGATEQASPTSL